MHVSRLRPAGGSPAPLAIAMFCRLSTQFVPQIAMRLACALLLLLLPSTLCARVGVAQSIASATTESAEHDLVESLPGYSGNFQSKHYAGEASA